MLTSYLLMLYEKAKVCLFFESKARTLRSEQRDLNLNYDTKIMLSLGVIVES